jgi:hypothetical protein
VGRGGASCLLDQRVLLQLRLILLTAVHRRAEVWARRVRAQRQYQQARTHTRTRTIVQLLHRRRLSLQLRLHRRRRTRRHRQIVREQRKSVVSKFLGVALV